MNPRHVIGIGVLLLLSAGIPSQAQVVFSDAHRPTVSSGGTFHGFIERRGSRKSGSTATLLGLLLPGAGHIYAGEPGRGVMFLAGTALAFSYAFSDPRCKSPFDDVRSCELEEKNELGVAASLIGTVAIYGFSVWDAHRAAHRTNVRRGIEVGDLEIIPYLAVSGFDRASGGLSVRLRPEHR